MWSKSPPGKASAVIVFLALLALSLYPQDACALSRWENHVDASHIKEIIYKDGVLVMATNGGVLLFDVVTEEFTRYGINAGLPSNDLTSLVYDTSGNLWVGTEDIGIAKVSLGASGLKVLKTFNEEFDGLSGNEVKSIAFRNGEVVYGTETGAGLFDQEIPATRFFMRHGLPSDVVNDVFVDGNFVWLATDSGTVVLDQFGFLTEPRNGPSIAFAVDRSDDAVWVGTDDGVWSMALSDSSWTQTGPAGESVHSLYWDGQTMWSGGKFKFYEFDGAQWLEHSLFTFFGKYGMTSSLGQVKSIAGTSSPGGEIFIGAGQPTAARGLNLIKYDGTTTNLRPNTPGSNKIVRLSRDVDGSVWVSARNFGVGKLTPAGKWVNYNTSVPGADSLSNLFANLTTLADSDGIKWFSTLSSVDNQKPLDELDDNLDDDYSNDSWTRHGLSSGGGDTYGSLRPQRAVEDPAGNRWFLSDDSDADNVPDTWHGINVLSKDKTEWLQVRPGTFPEMKGTNVTHVVFGDAVAYIALGYYGVQSWNVGQGFDWTSLTDVSDDNWELDARFGVEMISGGFATSLALRSDGVLWIGTGGGVIKFTPPDRFKRIEEDRGFGIGLLSPSVRYVLLDREENLWVATALGLNRIARDDDNDIQAFSTSAVYQTTLFKLQYPFSVVTPLVNADCNELLLHPQRDLLYVGTMGGLSIFDISPEALQETDVSKVYVYPNPVDISLGHNDLKIQNITGAVSIDVYNLEGDLVHSQTASEPGEVIWDLTTNEGFVTASGVYFVRISTGPNSVVRSVTIIR